MAACDRCLRRTWLLERMGSHLDFRAASLIDALALDDASLIGLTGGSMRSLLELEYAGFGAAAAQRMRGACATRGVEQICSCDQDYPVALRGLPAAPAVLHLAGRTELFQELCTADPVAIVGARAANEYGREVAAALGRGISTSGLTVVSGMASGVDAGAHAGALAAGARTLAVLPGFAADPYPKAQRQLHRRILESAVALSETGPGAPVRRWMFPARNRLIAALAGLVVVVQGRAGSGALLTVRAAHVYGRLVGAVPGSVLAAQSQAPNALLRAGAVMIRDAQDVLDAVFGEGVRSAGLPVSAALGGEPPKGEPPGAGSPGAGSPGAAAAPGAVDGLQLAVLEAIADGDATLAGLQRDGVDAAAMLSALASLELAGRVGRGVGGRLYVLA